MSLNAIASSALSALLTNTAALRVVSNNVGNMNTDGYARRVVNEQAQTAAGQLTGVSIADVQRVVDKFLTQEALSAKGSSSQYSAQNVIFNQLNGLLGSPGDNTALTARLDNIFSALGNAALAPTSSTSQQSVLAALQGMASTITSTYNSVVGLQSQVDQQVSSAVGTVNSLIKQIYTFNQQIQTAVAAGDTASGLLDQRDVAVKNLSQYMDIRTADKANGQTIISTGDGISLVGDSYAQLSYAGGASNGTYGSISLQTIAPATGQNIGNAQPLDSHLQSGQIKGLIDMRDGALSDMLQELGSLSRQTALAFNAQSNANTAFPPPSSLDGRNTGLLSSDALNFTGKTTVAVTDSTGALVSRIDVDFGAGTLSVDGGASTSIGSTVGSFATALNTALGANGSASFTNGALSISANGGDGIAVQDDPSATTARGGVGFSQFFGLNDVFHTSVPSVLTTGFAATDSSGLAAGGQMDFALKGPNGEIAKKASVTITAGMSMGDVITAMNTAFNGAASFALGSDGALTMTPASNYKNYQLNVTTDSTERGSTGMGFTQIFGLGVSQGAAPASGFAVSPALVTSPARLPLGQTSITASTVAGDTIITHGDARGALALQNVGSTPIAFAKVGGLGAQNVSLSDYAAGFYQDVATRSQAVSDNATAQSNRLVEAQGRQASVSGVNLDEELSNMVMYQQAYAAGARLLQTVGQLYDTLLQIQ
ncbi:MAG TPA: flagellar hook-associated protein FlgK [Rhizomicrobium sp.]|nr:flagellar hook-associated protein FlgK [Rhizomicrobium sp.]